LSKSRLKAGLKTGIMDIQTIIVVFIIVAALVYTGNILRHKIKAFKPKGKSCGADCGCSGNAKAKSN